MRGIRAFCVRLAAFFQRKTAWERDLAEELEINLQLQIEDNIRSGMSPGEARRLALMRFGGVELAKESYRDQKNLPPLQNLAGDLRHAVRMLRKSPVFTVVAVASLGLGIGANTAIFSVVRALLLKPLPYSDPGRLVALFESNASTGTSRVDTALANYEEWRDQTQSFEGVAASAYWVPALTGRGDAEQLLAGHVTANFFSTLGVRPAMGRDFTPEEDQEGRNTVVILSDAFWTGRLGRDPSVLGQELILDKVSYTIIGVMPPEFEHPNIDRRRQRIELWRPLGERGGKSRGPGYLRVVARLKPGVTIQRARAEISELTRRIARQHPHNAALEGQTVELASTIAEEARRPLGLLLGAVGLLLLVACANTSNLLLARGAERRHEFAIRAALGAPRSRLFRQVTTESLLLSAAGGGVGLLFAFWTKDALSALARSYVALARPMELDGWVLSFATAVSLGTGILFGLLPAHAASRAGASDALKSTSRASAGGRTTYLRSMLVISEVALTLILLTSAGLLLRSFWRMQSQDLGFEPQRVLTGEVRLKRGQEATAYNLNFMTGLLSRVKQLPGVEAAAMVEALPLSGRNNDSSFYIEGRPDPPPNAPQETMMNFCTPEYFRLMRIRLLQGRFFEDRDGAGKHQVIVINETLARRYFPGEDPIGKRVKLTPEWQTIVGVVADVKHRSLTAPPRAQVYLPYAQRALPRMTLAVRVSGDSAVLLKAIRKELAAMDPLLPLGNFRTIEQLLDDAVAPRRLSMLVLVLFACLAMVLAAVGIYGVISYAVAQRSKEIGVRIALGAQPTDVLSLVLRQGLRVVTIGLLLGLAVSLAATRSLGAMLFSVTPGDPLTLIGSMTMLFAVAFVAIMVPARRAARVDPIIAMRCD